MTLKTCLRKTLLISSSIIFLYLIALVFTTGLFERSEYNKAFREDYYTHFEDTRMQLLSIAILSPSSHNIQPWSVAMDNDDNTKMSLYIDSDRVLPVVDENYNQMIISCGIFIAYLEEAARKIGASITYELFPEGILPNNPELEEFDDYPIATFQVNKLQQDVSLDFDGFASATNKHNFNQELIQDSIISDLYLYQSANITLDFFEEDLDKMKTLLIKGVEVESINLAAMEETSSIFRYNQYQKNDFGYGLTINPSFTNRFILANIEMFNVLFPMSWEKEGQYWLNNEVKNISSCNRFGIIYGDDTRESQLETGIAFGKICLALANKGIIVQPIVQLTELYSDMSTFRQEFNESFAESKTTHMIYRLGYVDKASLNTIRLNSEDIIR